MALKLLLILEKQRTLFSSKNTFSILYQLSLIMCLLIGLQNIGILEFGSALVWTLKNKLKKFAKKPTNCQKCYRLRSYYLLSLPQSNRDQLQYRAAELCTGALHLTNQSKLEADLGWGTLETRANFLGLCQIQKFHLKLTRPLILSIMPNFNTNRKTRNTDIYSFHISPNCVPH